MDAIELVKKDHDRVEELFARFKGGGGLTGLVRRVTGSVTTRERKTALAGICQELDVHARLEEEILYPAILAIGDEELHCMVNESLGEHARVKELVADLRARPEGDDVDTRVSELEECVQHHVQEEENEMLPRVAGIMPEAKRNELGRRMQARKRALAPAARKRTETVRRAAGKRSATTAARGRRKAKTAGARKTKGKKHRAQ